MLDRAEVIERIVLLVAVIVLLCDVIFWRP
jgi:hypothetical protein